MPAEEPEAQAPDPQPDEAALAFRYSHRAATVTPLQVTATQLKGRGHRSGGRRGDTAGAADRRTGETRFLQEKRGLTGGQSAAQPCTWRCSFYRWIPLRYQRH